MSAAIKLADSARPAVEAAAYDTSDLCALLKLGRSKVYELIASGRIPGKLDLEGRAARFSRAKVDQWVLMGCPRAK